MSLKVVIIDDDEMVLSLLENYCKSVNSASCVKIPSAEAAIEYFSKLDIAGEEMPDLIFVDLFMDEADGFDVLDTLDDLDLEDVSSHVYMLSNDESKRTLEKCETFRFVNGFIRKPFSLTAFLEVYAKCETAES